jgi:hypothetical protein
MWTKDKGRIKIALNYYAHSSCWSARMVSLDGLGNDVTEFMIAPEPDRHKIIEVMAHHIEIGTVRFLVASGVTVAEASSLAQTFRTFCHSCPDRDCVIGALWSYGTLFLNGDHYSPGTMVLRWGTDGSQVLAAPDDGPQDLLSIIPTF